MERTFSFGRPAEQFPAILERFRGTPARVREMLGAESAIALNVRVDGAWSIQEHIGHLFDLEELGETRLQDFVAGKERLAAADMSNRKTEDAHHNEADARELVERFAAARASLVKQLEALDVEQVRRVSLHPRLNQPMSMADWLYFMCEHDDHHLARMRRLFRQQATANAATDQ
jgi:uncharacterized damage-inducible protein DinB